MDEIDQPRTVSGRSLPQDPVPQVEDVPGRVRRRSSSIRPPRLSSSGQGAKEATGSRFPWTAHAGPTRSPRLPQIDAPIDPDDVASGFADEVQHMPPVPVAKWMTGTPARSANSRTRRL